MAASPPVYSLDEGTVGKLLDMGLGKGIDATTSGHVLLDLQMRPVRAVVEQVTIGTGYKSFSSEVSSHSTLKRATSTQLALTSAMPVKLDFSTEVKRKEDTQIVRQAQGQQIHTRTLQFTIGDIQRAAGGVVERGQDCTDGDDKVPLSRFEALLLEQVKVEGLLYAEGEKIPLDKRIEISRQVLEEQNRGATHFISSVDLGAKIFRVKRKTVRKKGQSVSTSLSATGGSASAQGQMKVQFSDDCMEMVSSNSRHLHAVVHPAVTLKQTKTVVEPEHEKVISYEISPISELIQDKWWREAVAAASKQYVEKAMSMEPALIGTGGPFLITADDQYLQVNDDRIIGTPNPEEADEFYVHTLDAVFEDDNSDLGSDSDDGIDPLKNPSAGFYIYYKTNGGQNLFLCADSNYGLVKLVSKTTDSASGKFFLEAPSSHVLAPLTDWPVRPLHLVRKTAYLKRRQYLVLKKAAPAVLHGDMSLLPERVDADGKLVLHALLGESAVASEVLPRCQFAIQNAGLTSKRVKANTE